MTYRLGIKYVPHPCGGGVAEAGGGGVRLSLDLARHLPIAYLHAAVEPRILHTVSSRGTRSSAAQPVTQPVSFAP